MEQSVDNFYVALFSNNSIEQYPSNTLSSFVNKLPQPVHLEGSWVVGLSHISYGPFAAFQSTEHESLRMGDDDDDELNFEVETFPAVTRSRSPQPLPPKKKRKVRRKREKKHKRNKSSLKFRKNITSCSLNRICKVSRTK